MNTRVRYNDLKHEFPNAIIVLGGDEADPWKLRAYDDSAEILRWTNGAVYYKNANDEPGLYIGKLELLKRYKLVEIAESAWKVIV